MEVVERVCSSFKGKVITASSCTSAAPGNSNCCGSFRALIALPLPLVLHFAQQEHNQVLGFRTEQSDALDVWK